MIRETSIESYNKIKDNGLLSEKRQKVYEALYANGPMTGMELRALFSAAKIDSQVRARLTELRSIGVAKEVGKRVCSITGMKVILWDVTSKIPLKFDKPTKLKCKACNGSGYITIVQTKMF